MLESTNVSATKGKSGQPLSHSISQDHLPLLRYTHDVTEDLQVLKQRFAPANEAYRDVARTAITKLLHTSRNTDREAWINQFMIALQLGQQLRIPEAEGAAARLYFLDAVERIDPDWVKFHKAYAVRLAQGERVQITALSLADEY